MGDQDIDMSIDETGVEAFKQPISGQEQALTQMDEDGAETVVGEDGHIVKFAPFDVLHQQVMWRARVNKLPSDMVTALSNCKTRNEVMEVYAESSHKALAANDARVLDAQRMRIMHERFGNLIDSAYVEDEETGALRKVDFDNMDDVRRWVQKSAPEPEFVAEIEQCMCAEEVYEVLKTELSKLSISDAAIKKGAMGKYMALLYEQRKDEMKEVTSFIDPKTNEIRQVDFTNREEVMEWATKHKTHNIMIQVRKQAGDRQNIDMNSALVDSELIQPVMDEDEDDSKKKKKMTVQEVAEQQASIALKKAKKLRELRLAERSVMGGKPSDFIDVTPEHLPYYKQLGKKLPISRLKYKSIFHQYGGRYNEVAVMMQMMDTLVPQSKLLLVVSGEPLPRVSSALALYRSFGVLFNFLKESDMRLPHAQFLDKEEERLKEQITKVRKTSQDLFQEGKGETQKNDVRTMMKDTLTPIVDELKAVQKAKRIYQKEKRIVPSHRPSLELSQVDAHSIEQICEIVKAEKLKTNAWLSRCVYEALETHRNDPKKLCETVWAINQEYAVHMINCQSLAVLLFFEEEFGPYRGSLIESYEVPFDDYTSENGMRCYPPTVELVNGKRDIIHRLRRGAGLFAKGSLDHVNFDGWTEADFDAPVVANQPYSPSHRMVLEHIEFLAYDQTNAEDVLRRLASVEGALEQIMDDGAPKDDYADIIANFEFESAYQRAVVNQPQKVDENEDVDMAE